MLKLRLKEVNRYNDLFLRVKNREMKNRGKLRKGAVLTLNIKKITMNTAP
jgi:hypothetical protein